MYFQYNSKVTSLATQRLVISEAYIEGIDVDEQQMYAIFNGEPIWGLTALQLDILNNLFASWQYLYDTLGCSIDMLWLRELNKRIGASHVIEGSGELRSVPVGITGTDYKPSIPDRDNVAEKLQALQTNYSGQELAMKMFCYLSRSQLFIDGNKRVAQLTANKILIESNNKTLLIPKEKKELFGKLLVEYYETEDDTYLSEFLIHECLR